MEYEYYKHMFFGHIKKISQRRLKINFRLDYFLHTSLQKFFTLNNSYRNLLDITEII